MSYIVTLSKKKKETNVLISHTGKIISGKIVCMRPVLREPTVGVALDLEHSRIQTSSKSDFKSNHGG